MLLNEACLTGIPDTLAVAVSGGGDSMALLHMLAARYDLRAVTVDHGLRPKGADEAAMVAGFCQTFGVPHVTLKWHDWDRKGNLQSEARRARLRLIGDWARDQGITHIALGHTLDDQAETVLLRLLRGSGVDGLSGMAERRQDEGLTWIRPLLHARRADLRAYLRDRGIDWVDDPSNDDPHYARVRARKAIAALGLEVEGLADTATRLRRARAVLELDTVALADAVLEITDAGEVQITRAAFDLAPDELRLRLMAGALRWVSGAPYRPRFDSLVALLEDPDGRTLHGCVIRLRSGKISVRREVSKVPPPASLENGVWDNRWIAEAESGAPGATHIGALGEEGLQQCGNWRETGHAREVLLASPALRKNGVLVAAPLAGMANGWACRLKEGKKGLNNLLMSG